MRYRVVPCLDRTQRHARGMSIARWPSVIRLRINRMRNIGDAERMVVERIFCESSQRLARDRGGDLSVKIARHELRHWERQAPIRPESWFEVVVNLLVVTRYAH